MSSGTCLFEILTLSEFKDLKEKDINLKDINLNVHLFEAHPKTETIEVI
jgi:hypothetical protein